MTVLVTGAFGLVGSATVAHLVAEAHEILKRRAAYYRAPGTYADPWGAVGAKWGDPRPDAAAQGQP